ncbi:MAG: HEPN domain-containing protein [Methanocella sp.]
MSRTETWLIEAEADLETAGILFAAGRYNACAFYCQQGAGKAVKALLFALHEAPWGHSVTELLEKASSAGREIPGHLVEQARELDMHYIPARYPDALPAGTPSGHYTKAMGERALKCATEILSFVKAQL